MTMLFHLRILQHPCTSNQPSQMNKSPHTLHIVVPAISSIPVRLTLKIREYTQLGLFST